MQCPPRRACDCRSVCVAGTPCRRQTRQGVGIECARCDGKGSVVLDEFGDSSQHQLEERCVVETPTRASRCRANLTIKLSPPQHLVKTIIPVEQPLLGKRKVRTTHVYLVVTGFVEEIAEADQRAQFIVGELLIIQFSARHQRNATLRCEHAGFGPLRSRRLREVGEPEPLAAALGPPGIERAAP